MFTKHRSSDGSHAAGDWRDCPYDRGYRVKLHVSTDSAPGGCIDANIDDDLIRLNKTCINETSFPGCCDKNIRTPADLFDA